MKNGSFVFRTGTQILIYFPVLLKISSVTLGQLLWEKHAKAPKWLTNLSPFSKRGIAADSQRDKHMRRLTVARAIPKVSVLPHHFPVPSTTVSQRKCLSSEGPWKTSRRWRGRDQLPSDLLWVPWSRQTWELLPLMVSGFCSIFISGSSLGEAQVWCLDLCGQKMEGLTWSVGLLWETQELLAIGILLGSKRKNQEQPFLSRASGFGVGNLPPGSLPTHSSQPQRWKQKSRRTWTSQKSKGSGKKEEQGHAALSCPQSVKLNCSKNAELPFSCLDPWASVSGVGMK